MSAGLMILPSPLWNALRSLSRPGSLQTSEQVKTGSRGQKGPDCKEPTNVNHEILPVMGY